MNRFRLPRSDIIVLGVKPVYMKGILAALAPHLEPRHLVVSIAAGLKLEGLEAALPDGTRVVRVMPNTPCLIGAAASTYVMGSHASEEDKEKVDALMSSVGECTFRQSDPSRCEALTMCLNLCSRQLLPTHPL
jgi:pyrroline-5-carboxylate reductase